MKKVFLYLYPIKEYASFLAMSDEFCEKKGYEKPFVVLNECIQRRYREKGYEIILVKYPDKEIFSVEVKPEDRIISTDITFSQASGYDKDEKKKPIEEIKYPSEEDILQKVGQVDEIVIGGYHYSDCVKSMAEHFYNAGINTLVDLELTDLFFSIYRSSTFDKSNYSPSIYRQRFMKRFEKYGDGFAENQFGLMYDSPTYHFDDEKIDIKKI